MDEQRIDNRNVVATDLLAPPEEIRARQPRSARAEASVLRGRRSVEQILERSDPRLLIVVGPCSIHDPVAAIEYARRLAALAEEVSDTLCVVMRVYFEKPRTTTGWKGLINDPHLDDSFDIEYGIQLARKLLLEINELGLPAGTEALDPVIPQYLGDLISWSAIGARTTESQTHRELASGLSTPVGFKNGTDGSSSVAVNALLSVSKPHSFLGIHPSGRVAVIRTQGNAHGHIVLRGGSQRPNCDAASIAQVERELAKHALAANIVVDCSHANASKDYARQPLVLKEVVRQIRDGNESIVGAMLESFLHAGNQPIPADRTQLRYGVSITDPCIDWPATEALLREARDELREVLRARSQRAAPMRS